MKLGNTRIIVFKQQEHDFCELKMCIEVLTTLSHLFIIILSILIKVQRKD